MTKRMKLGHSLIVGALLLAFFLSGLASAEELTGRQIMEKVDRMHRSKDEKTFSQLTIYDSRGKSRKRELDAFMMTGEGDDDMLLVRFTAPSRIKGTALLTQEHSDRDDDQWVFLPALRKSKRIASSDKTESFAGTDFTYEDMRTEDLGRMRYELQKTEEIDGKKCYVVAAVPATEQKAEESGYSKRLIYVWADEFLTLKVDFFDKQNRHAKTLLISDHKKVKDLWRPFKSEMNNLLEGTKTLWISKKREPNAGLSESIFTKRELERS